MSLKMKRANPYDNRTASMKSEKRSARVLGMRLTVNSRKGDFYSSHVLVEEKTTKKPQFRVRLETLTKLWMDGHKRNKLPVLLVKFTGEKVSSDEYFFVLTEDDYAAMKDVHVDTFKDYGHTASDATSFLVKKGQDCNSKVSIMTGKHRLVIINLPDMKEAIQQYESRCS